MKIKKWLVKLLPAAAILVFFCKPANAQLIYQPYSYLFYQKLNSEMYSPSTSLHTSLKPYIIDSGALRHTYDSLLNRGVDSSRHSWVSRKLFNEHLFDVKDKDFTFYADFFPDLGVGRELTDKTSTWLNTRGYQAGGTIGQKFFFYTSGYENQAAFPNYLNTYVVNTGVVPGQAYDFNAGVGDKDWLYVTSLIGYEPNKNISIETGIDKTFIGDGYRSMLLSDFAQNYPLLRGKFNLGKHVQYMAMWAYLQDHEAPKFDIASGHGPNRVKWAAFHYIDWNITNRASLGFFNALLAPDAYDNGATHGFDVNYIDPILFSKSIAPSGPIPDNTLIGFNGKYKVLDKTVIYSQLLFDQSSTSGNNKQSFQAGFRGSDLFKVNSLNYLVEYNTSKPYTYSAQDPLMSYDEFNEPLADPLGANFRELIGLLSYSIGRFDFRGELEYAKLGLSTDKLNYGNDLLLPDVMSLGNTTGQGLNTTLKYAQGTISFLINPKTNLRLEAGAVLRQEENVQGDVKTVWLTFGLRSTFRDLYSDF